MIVFSSLTFPLRWLNAGSVRSSSCQTTREEYLVHFKQLSAVDNLDDPNDLEIGRCATSTGRNSQDSVSTDYLRTTLTSHQQNGRLSSRLHFAEIVGTDKRRRMRELFSGCENGEFKRCFHDKTSNGWNRFLSMCPFSSAFEEYLVESFRKCYSKNS